MRFIHDGETFSISFHRQHRPVDVAHVEGEKPKRMYTTVNIYVYDNHDPSKKYLFRTATVSVWHKEPDQTKELGRLRALKSLAQGRMFLPKMAADSKEERARLRIKSNHFKREMFKAYFTRPRPVSVEKVKNDQPEAV